MDDVVDQQRHMLDDPNTRSSEFLERTEETIGIVTTGEVIRLFDKLDYLLLISCVISFILTALTQLNLEAQFCNLFHRQFIFFHY